MLKVHKLHQPNKHSGTPLEPGKTLKLRGILVTNKNDFRVFVDTFDRKPWKPTKKSSAKAKKAA